MPAASEATPSVAPAQTVSATPPQQFTACLVTDTGGINDRSYNQTAWKGIQRAQVELDIEGRYLESSTFSDFAANISTFVKQGCNIVITVAFQLGDATEAAAYANPDQLFSIVDFAYPRPIPNVQGQVFNTHESAFLAGYLAAAVSRTEKVGTFGGLNIFPVTFYMDGFFLGVQYYNQQKGADVQVLGWDALAQAGLFIGDFFSESEGRRLAELLMHEGVDIIMPVAGRAGLGAAAAAQERGGVYLIGVDSDWVVTSPDYANVILTSALKNMDVTTFNSIKDAMDGSYEGPVTIGTLANAGVGLASFYELASLIPDEVLDELEEIRQGIIEGDIETLP